MPIKHSHLLVVTGALLCGLPRCASGHRQKSPQGALKAVYLVGDKGELQPADLKVHPEVAVVHTWADFQTRAARRKIALWIDKGARSLLKNSKANVWLNQPPQKWNPVVLVGYHSELYAFREVLPYFGINGPYVDWSQQQVEPGFSLWQLQAETRSSRSALMHGFKTKPSVKTILHLTEAWLSAYKRPSR